MPDADVLCRELGFKMGASEIRLNSFYAANPKFNTDKGNPLFVMDEIECFGNETSLKECKFNGWGVHDCNAEEVCSQKTFFFFSIILRSIIFSRLLASFVNYL
jgi:HGF/MSP/plasminogen-like protein